MTSAATSAPAQDRGAHAPSNTPRVLRRLRTALVALAVLAGATAALLTIEQHTVSSSAGAHTATAVIQAYAARQALVDADSQAIQTIPLGAGESGQYQDDTAAAAQSLEQVAENNTAGPTGTGALLLLAGLLNAYTTQVHLADVYYRMQGSTAEKGVGLGFLRSASELMHSEILTDGQTLRNGNPDSLQAAAKDCLARPPNPSDQRDSLADLQCYEQQALSGQRSSPWVSPWLFAAWVVVALAVAITLAAAQRQFSRRLRRLLSKYLTLAAAALIGLGLVTAHVIAAEHAFAAAQAGPLATVLNLQDYQTAATDDQGQTALANNVLKRECGKQCAAEQTLAKQQAASDAPVKSSAYTALQKTLHPVPDLAHVPVNITAQQRDYDAHTTAAEAGYARSLGLIVALTALLVLLVFLGFRRHLEEYRY